MAKGDDDDDGGGGGGGGGGDFVVESLNYFIQLLLLKMEFIFSQFTRPIFIN